MKIDINPIFNTISRNLTLFRTLRMFIQPPIRHIYIHPEHSTPIKFILPIIIFVLTTKLTIKHIRITSIMLLIMSLLCHPNLQNIRKLTEILILLHMVITKKVNILAPMSIVNKIRTLLIIKASFCKEIPVLGLMVILGPIIICQGF